MPLQPSLEAVRLSRARHELELPALHHLFEHAELRLLAHVEHLIDAVVGLSDFHSRPRLELLERLQPIFNLAFIGLRIGYDPLTSVYLPFTIARYFVFPDHQTRPARVTNFLSGR